MDRLLLELPFLGNFFDYPSAGIAGHTGYSILQLLHECLNMAPWWRSLIDFFFPPRCPSCGETIGESEPYPICSSCFGQIKMIFHPMCPRCGIGFATDVGEDHFCSDCLQDCGHFTKARSLAHYEGLMADLISRFKYRGSARLAAPLSHLLAEYTDGDFSFCNYSLIMPVPLHPRRLRQRGYNQSLLLARTVSRKHSIPLDYTSLRRIRPTQPQTELSGPQRQKNVHGAFAVRKKEAVAEKTILLIDDVFTTGATVEECARALLKSGSKRVDVLTLVRAR
jgi:ComF family protein